MSKKKYRRLEVEVTMTVSLIVDADESVELAEEKFLVKEKIRDFDGKFFSDQISYGHFDVKTTENKPCDEEGEEVCSDCDEFYPCNC